MELQAAVAVALRVLLILLAAAMCVGLRSEIWAVVRKRPGWHKHLSSAVFAGLVVAGAIISSVNLFPDAGLAIPRTLRLAVVNLGLSLFLVATITGLYRRALKAGPDRARAAFLTGTSMVIPAVGLVWLLTVSGNA